MNQHGSINRIFRLVWNDALSSWVPAAETTRSRGKRSGRSTLLWAPLLAACALPAYSADIAPAPDELPTGARVVAGSAVIAAGSTPGAAVLNVNQTTQRAAIDWSTFNVGRDAELNFNQPGRESATLNRVLDTSASQIYGRIKATGQVFLTNPQGVYFSKSASVDVGSLAATTDKIGTAEFMAGNIALTRDGATGSVINEGTLRAALGGYIALLAPEVRNSGVVIAQLGTVAMASGDAMTLTFEGTQLVDLTVQPAAIAGLIENKGAVMAPGGLIILSARALDRLQGGVVNNSGTLEATGLAMMGGRVVLEAGSRVDSSGAINVDAGAEGSPAGSVSLTSAQDIAVSGSISAAAIDGDAGAADRGGSITLVAGNDVALANARLEVSGAMDAGSIHIQGGSESAPASGNAPSTLSLGGSTELRAASSEGKGGDVSLTATRVGLFDTAAINTSGATAGGEVLVGGGFQGADSSLANAQRVIIDTAATIDASATHTGNGGDVVIWSDERTAFAGSIISRGGEGGAVEVSSKGTLDFLGTVDAGALLLDPKNITVDTIGTAVLTSGVLAFNTDPAGDSIIAPAAITAVSNTGTAVTLQANNDLTINSAITSNNTSGSGGNLTFQAGRTITVNASVVSDSGNISFTANDPNAGAANRTVGTATFTNNGLINSGAGTTTIILGDFAGASGSITLGHVVATNLVVTHRGPTPGADIGAIDIGEVDIANNMTITSTTDRNLTNILGSSGAAGSVLVRGTTSINVGAGDVTIDGVHTDFNFIGLVARNVTLNDTNAMQFAATTLSGNLSETAVGPIASTGAVIVAGTTSLTANTGGFGYADPYINLTNAANHFGGAVTLSVPTTGETRTGGHITMRDSGAMTVTSAGTATSLTLQTGGATTLGTVNVGTTLNVSASAGAVSLGTTTAVGAITATATGGSISFGTTSAGGQITATSAGAATFGTTNTGSSISVASSSGLVSLGATTATGSLSITAADAVNLGTTTLGSSLTIATAGAITDSGPLTVPTQTILTAGPTNNITLDDPNNDLFAIRVISGLNVTLVDKNALNFGANQSISGYDSHIYGALNVTAKGNISQTNPESEGFSAITVDGASTFTANALTPINLLLGPSDPFGNSGEANTFTGGVTLLRATDETGFSAVQLRNTSASAVVLTGLTTVGSLASVALRFDNAPSVSLPGMTISGNLRVSAQGVVNTATIPGNLISQAGPITVGGGTIITAGATGDIVLDNAANNFNQFGVAGSGGRNVTVRDSNALVMYAAGYGQAVTGNYSVTAAGSITDLGSTLAVSTGTLTLDAGSANDINLTRAFNYLNIVEVRAANNVVVNPVNSVILGNASIAGTLSMSSVNGGSLTQVATTAVSSGSTTTFGNFNTGITLANIGNVMGPLAISGSAALDIRENDAITQASAWSNYNGGNGVGYAVTLTTSNDQAITLDLAGNYLGALTIRQLNTGALTAGPVHIRETADSTAGMTQGSAWSVHGTTRVDSGTYLIDLNNADNVFGPLQVIGATGVTNGVTSTVTLSARNTASADAISDVNGPGAWATATGVVKLVAYDVTGVTAGGGNVNLTNTGNVLGDLYIKATNATITENDNITDGINASWNSASNTGWVTTGATNLVVANSTGKSIVLDNLTNQLGPLSVIGSGGTLSSVLITDNTDLTQGSLWNVGTTPVTLDARSNILDLSTFDNVLGNLTIATVNGVPDSVSITENDPITQGSTWSLNGVPVTLTALNEQAITVTNASNILGALTVTGGIVSITENDNITQAAAWATTGATTLNPTDGLITLTNAANVLGPLAIAGSPTTVRITENADITQASAWVQAETLFVLNAGTHDIVLSEAANELGDLTLTAQNLTVTESDVAGITDAGAWIIPGATTLTAGGGNPVILNANPAHDFGTVSIVSASDVDIIDRNAIEFGTSTVSAAGTMTVTAAAGITQTGAITAPSLRLIGLGLATLTNTSNNVSNLAAGFSGGDLTFVNSGDFAIALVGGTSGITIGANDVTLTSALGTVTGLSNINSGSRSLTITTGTALLLPQLSIAGAQTYTASTVSGTGVTLGAGIVSTAAGAISFNSAVTLAADLTIQSANSPINFAATLDGALNQLTLNAGTGPVRFFGAVSALGNTEDAAAALSLTSSGARFDSTLDANNGLAITGPVIFNDTVTLADGNAASVFTGLVTLGKAGGMNLSGFDGMTFSAGVLLQNGDATIDSNDSALVFQTAGTVSGPYGLTLDSGTQSLVGLNRMGANLTRLTVTAFNPTIPVGGVTIAGPQTYTATNESSITLSGNVTSTAAGAITFNSAVTLGAASTISSTNSDVIFGSTLDGARDLTVSSGTGANVFTDAVGSLVSVGDSTGAALTLVGTGPTTFISTVQTRSGITAGGAVAFNANATFANGDTASTFAGMVSSGGVSGNTISGFDGLAFDGGLTLTSGAVSVLSNGGTLSFGGPVTGPQNLTLNALADGVGVITGLDQIGFTSNLTGLSVTAQTLDLPATGLAVPGPMTFTAADGINVNGPAGNNSGPATGQIDFNGPVILATGPIVVSTSDAAVNFNNIVNGAQTLTVNAGTGTTTFGSTVGATTALTRLVTDAGGITNLNGAGVRTTAEQTYNDSVRLGANNTLTGVAVLFASTIDGAFSLTVIDSGVTTFSDAIGSVDPLASVTTNAAGTVVVNSATVTTTGTQTYNDNMTLGADTSFSGVALTFGGTVEGARNLTANAGTGALRFLQTVGELTPLASINGNGNTISMVDAHTTGTQTYTAPGGLTLNGNLSTTASNLTATGPTTLGADVIILTTGGDITFAGATSTINGAHYLTLDAGLGDVVLGGVVGGVVPLLGITVSGYDLTLPGITTASDANQVYTALNDITLNQSRTLNAPIAFTADSDDDGSGTFILLNGVSLTASNNTLTVSAADLDLQGNSTMSSGSGLMSVTASNARNIALGGDDAPGTQMTISGAELSRMSSSSGLNLLTTLDGWIHVDGITATQSQNITGTLSLLAQGTGDVSFINAASTFNAVTANATGDTTNIAVDLTTTNDAIRFITPVAIAGTSTISSGGSNISFDSTLAVDNDLTLTTSNGILNFAGAVGSDKTLTLNLGAGSVTGLNQLQTTLTGFTVNATSAITLPAITITGPQVYNTGTITVTGDLGGVGIAFNNLVDVVPASGNTLTMNAGTGTLAFSNLAFFNAVNMVLTADEVNFARAVTGTGSLLVQPFTATQNVAAGGASALLATLNLTAAELALLPTASLSSLTLGRAAGTGSLTLAGTLNTSSTPLTLNGGGGITQSGGGITSGALTLYGGANALSLLSSTNAFGAVAINGTPSALSLTNTLNITQLGGAAWNLGTSPVMLNAGPQDITLSSTANLFGTLSLTGGEVHVTEGAATDIGASSISKNLVVASSSDINVSGALSTTGNVSFTSAGRVTQSAPLTIGGRLDVTTTVNAGNVFVDNSGATATTLGNTYIGGDYTLTAAGRSVSQAPNTSLQVRGNLSITASSIVLGGAGNLIGGTTTLPSANTVVVRQAGVITLANRTETGSLTVISERTNRSFGSLLVTGDAVILNNASNNIAGNISVSARPPVVTTGTDAQTGINQSNGTSISVAGVASFTAEASAAGSLGINLTNSGNNFGTLVLSAGTVAVTNSATALTTIGTALATNSLTLNTAGGVAQTGAITTPVLAVNATGSVMLNNTANDANTISVGSSGGAISYVDANDISVTALNAGGGAASLTAGGSGNLTQSGALLNVGALSANAGGAVTLTNAANTVGSLAASTAASGMQLFDSTGGIVVTGIARTSTGDMQLRTAGDLTLNGAGRLEADTGNVFASTEGAGNFINNVGTSALLAGSGKRWLVYSNTPDLVLTAHTVKGGLTSSFRHYGAVYNSYGPLSVTEGGNGFIYRDAAATLTVSAAINGTPSHVYGDTPTGALTYAISGGLLDSEDNVSNIITGGSAAYSAALANTMNAAAYSIRYTGGLTSNYALTASPTGVTYTVTPAVLTYTANAASRAYGAVNPTFSGTLSGFKLSDTSSILTGTASWTTPAVAGSNAGQYAINGSGYGVGSNYTFAQAIGNATALTISRFGLVITANNDSKTYNGLNYSGGAGVSYSGFANGESASSLGGVLAYGGDSQGARNVGTYTITPSGLTSGNYDVSFQDGSLLVGSANINLTTTNVTKTYDGTLAALGTAVASPGTPLLGSDTLSGGTFAFTNANAGAGNRSVSVSDVVLSDGNNGGNYNVSYVNNTTSTINAASLGVTTSDVVKTYDGALVAAGTATVTSGTLFTNASNNNIQDSLSGGTFTFTNANAGVGNRTVTTSGVTVNDGNGGLNYALSYTSNTTSTINQAPLEFLGAVATRTYDGTTLASLSGYTLNGLVNNETVTALPTAVNFSDANAGIGKTVTISGITLGSGANGGLASNYSINATAFSTGTIDPKLLTVNASVADKVYDGTRDADLQSYSLSGFVDDETVTGVYTGTTEFFDKNAGVDKAVTITGITLEDGTNGGLARNYSISTVAGSSADITQATLNVEGVGAVDKIYDGTLFAYLNTQAAILSGVIGQDSVGVGSITGAYQTKDVGADKPIGTGTFVLTGADANNYTLIQPTNLTGSITPRNLVVSGTATDKVYDGTTSATVSLTDDHIAGDSVIVSSAEEFLDKNAGVGKYVNIFDIAITGADAGNYTANSSTSAFATVSRADLEVDISAANKAYDTTTAATVSLEAHPIGTDVVTVAYTTATFDNKNAGLDKVVTINDVVLGGIDGGNYQLLGVSATGAADITPIALTVSATGQDKIYDGTNFAQVTLTTAPLGGDVVDATYESATFIDRDVGDDKLVNVSGIGLTGADARNYIGNDTATTTGDISENLTATAASVWYLPPTLPQELVGIPSELQPVMLDLGLPDSFGTGTITDTPAIAGGRGSGAGIRTRVVVSTLRAATNQMPGMMAVTIPDNIDGFRFQLPSALVGGLAANDAQVTLVNGELLPSWLRYDRQAGTLVAVGMPEGGMPIEILVGNGLLSWTVLISQPAEE